MRIREGKNEEKNGKRIGYNAMDGNRREWRERERVGRIDRDEVKKIRMLVKEREKREIEEKYIR